MTTSAGSIPQGDAQDGACILIRCKQMFVKNWRAAEPRLRLRFSIDHERWRIQPVVQEVFG